MKKGNCPIPPENWQDFADCFEFMCHYFWTEMEWETFRADFLSQGDTEYENCRMENARRVAAMLESCGKKWPKLKILLDQKVEPM